jgi:hypothetical protein
MRILRTLGRPSGVVIVLAAAVAAGVVSWASTGQAATNFAITLSPLLGTTGQDIPQVSYGGKIGYHLHIENNDTNNTQHASVRVTSNLAAFSDAVDPSCVKNGDHEMVCTPFGGTFSPGAVYDLDLRFTAPLTGPDVGELVKTCASISISAQTVGGKKNGNSGTTIANSCPTGFDDPGAVVTNVVENTETANTYLHAKEHAETGTKKTLTTDHPQNFGVQMPDTLFGNPFGVALSIHDNIGTKLCDTCLDWWTTLSIPVAALTSTPGNPFFDGANVSAYSWSMNAQYSTTKPTQIIHIDDNAAPQKLPKCSDVGGAPSQINPMCYDSFDPSSSNGTPKTASATGRGIENGNITFG